LPNKYKEAKIIGMVILNEVKQKFSQKEIKLL